MGLCASVDASLPYAVRSPPQPGASNVLEYSTLSLLIFVSFALLGEIAEAPSQPQQAKPEKGNRFFVILFRFVLISLFR
jgi:hypothetical protein